MKKILIFSTAYLPLIGGAEIAVKELTDRLIDFEFDLICARLKKALPPKEKIGRVTVYRVGFGSNWDKFLLPWLGVALAGKMHRTREYSLIWAIMASFGGLAALRFKIKLPAVPYLLTLQEGDTPAHIYARAKWLGPCYKKIFTAADFITAISAFLKNFAWAQGAKAPLEIVPNGVDTGNFKLRMTNHDLRKKLGYGANDKIIITVSRLVEKNGVGDLIEAMKYLPREVKLLIIGDGALKQNYELRIKKYELNNRILMLGAIENKLIAEYLSLADVFVRPSLAEGQGIVFLEAMAAGVPVIATPVGGIVDFLRAGRTGLFCAAGNPQSIAETIKKLFNNQGLAETIKTDARELVVKNYDWRLIAKKLEAIFNKLID